MLRDLIIAAVCFLIAIAGLMILEGCVDPLPEREPVDTERIAARASFHGADEVYSRDGVWYFDRDGRRCRL